MWKRDDVKPAPPTPQQPAATPAVPAAPRVEVPKFSETRTEVAHIGKSVLIKGELSGSEDLYLDGEVEGSVVLHDHSITVGPHGRVRANVNAREIVVHGKVEGNLEGSERVELKRTAVLLGDIATQRIVIEDGAYFKGAIDIQKESKPEPKAEPKRESAMAAAAGASASSFSSPLPSSTATSLGATPQPSLLDKKF